MSQNRKQVFTIAIALLAVFGATAATADFKGTDEELAGKLNGHLEELVFIADSFSKVEEGEKVATNEAMTILARLASTAREIEQRFEKKGDSSNLRPAKALAGATKDAQAELSKYALDKSTPKLCEKALGKVLETGGVVREILISPNI